MTIALQGNWVLVAAGDYYEPGTVLVRNVHLVGVCAARVVWHESSFTPLTVRGVTFHLRSFTVRGGFQGLTARDGANLEIERVRVEDMSGCGVLARGEGSVVRIRDSVIRGARPDAMNRNGYGLLADSGGVVFAERTAILDTQRVGVFAAADGSIDLAQSIVRGTRSVGLNAGFGVSNGLGGRVHGAGVVIDDNQKTGVVALGSGDGIRLEASVVRDTRALEGAYGAGLSAQEGGSLRIERVRVERNTGNGVLTSGEGSRAEVLSSVVMGTRAGSGGSESFGVNSRAGASSSVVGSIISGSSGSGVLVSGRARLELSATRVLDSRVAGLTAQLGAELHASGVLVDGAEQFGLRVVGEGTRAEVTASAFRNIMAPGSPVPATGVAAASDAVLDARGVVVERVRGFGVVSYLSATLSIADALVLDISSTGSSSGYGLAAFAGSINAARTAVVRATTASVSCGSGRKAGGVEYPGRFDGRDLFLRDVHSNVLTGYEGEPTRDAAFGFYLPNGVGSLDRAAIIGGRAGFYSGGSLTFSNGVVARQSETFGVTNPRLPASANRFSNVASIDNQVGEVVRDAFPSSAAFEAPTPICASDVCQ